MTIDQLFEKGIIRIRKPNWNPEAFLMLNVVEDGKYYSPWGELHDPVCFRAGICPEVQKMLLSSGDDDWVAHETQGRA